MQIISANIQLAGSHAKEEQRQVRETLVAGVSFAGLPWSRETLDEGVVFERQETSRDASYSQQLRQSVEALQDEAPRSIGSEDALNELKRRALGMGGETIDLDSPPAIVPEIDTSTLNASTSGQPYTDSFSEPVELENLDAETYLLKLLVESFSGAKIELRHIDTQAPPTPSIPGNTSLTPASNAADTEAASMQPQFGVLYEYSEHYNETETSLFHGLGQVTTIDGQQIDFNLSLTMHSEFTQDTEITMALGAARLMDPLVINFGDDHANLSDTQYSFDLNADGVNEHIAFAQGDSGFLSLDINGNGSIDDGRELFGALSGNGFADLRAYDEDGNGFIDAADSVFTRLSITQLNQNYVLQTSSLEARDVGAIYLGYEQTPFDLKDDANNLRAVVRSSGLFIHEDGKVGTVQQIDLVV